jgi:hypothetical protein
MFLIYVLIYAILIVLSLLGGKKYKDRLLFWCAGVGAVLLAASVWQYLAVNVLVLPSSLQIVSLFLVQILRFVVIGMLVFAAIKIFCSRT